MLVQTSFTPFTSYKNLLVTITKNINFQADIHVDADRLL